MKCKWLAIALAMGVCVSLVGCGSEDKTTTEALTTQEETTAGMTVMDLPDFNAADFVGKIDYKGIEVTVANKTVTDAEFEQALQMFLEDYGTVQQITDRVTAEGDTIVFDYSGAVDGKVFEGGTATNQTTELDLSSKNWIDGFEEGLIGKACGEEFVVDCYFPENYGKEELNGKTAQFTMKIHYIKGELILPELTDDFVKGLEDYTVGTVEEFKTVLREELSQQKADYMDNAAMDEVWGTLLENTEFKGYPENYVETYVQDMMNNYAYSAAMYNMSMEDFAGIYGMSLTEFEELVQQMAEEQVKTEILYKYIGQAENMTVTEEEYLEVVKGYMDYYKYEDMTSFVNDYGVDIVEKQGNADALMQKVMKFCYDNAVKTEAPPETEAETTADVVG